MGQYQLTIGALCNSVLHSLLRRRIRKVGTVVPFRLKGVAGQVGAASAGEIVMRVGLQRIATGRLRMPWHLYRESRSVKRGYNAGGRVQRHRETEEHGHF